MHGNQNSLFFFAIIWLFVVVVNITQTFPLALKIFPVSLLQRFPRFGAVAVLLIYPFDSEYPSQFFAAF